MNEINFIVRRILKEAEEYAEMVYNRGKDQPKMKLVYMEKRRAHQEIIDHIRKQFTDENS